MKKKELGLFLSLALLIYMAVASEKMLLVAEGYAVPHEVIETGREVYFEHCHRCHGESGAGAPAIGDAREWDRRIEKGMPPMIAHAMEEHRSLGFLSPPEGFGPDNDQISSAVAYLVRESGKFRQERP